MEHNTNLSKLSPQAKVISSSVVPLVNVNHYSPFICPSKSKPAPYDRPSATEEHLIQKSLQISLRARFCEPASVLVKPPSNPIPHNHIPSLSSFTPHCGWFSSCK